MARSFAGPIHNIPIHHPISLQDDVIKIAWSRIRSHFSSHANDCSYHGTRVGRGWSMLCVVIMRRDRGFLYMSELDIGLVVPAWFMALLECKFGDLKARRDVVLKAAKLTAEKGIVDMVVGNAEETVEAAVGLGRIRVCLETVAG
ncbi:hypothetical protein D5086_015857 [Populus alba]|uniref:Uncharacterized protein n=1 Tax=Populus alba TaxID=43335 RepID=A0ACC4BSD4_POPAL